MSDKINAIIKDLGLKAEQVHHFYKQWDESRNKFSTEQPETPGHDKRSRFLEAHYKFATELNPADILELIAEVKRLRSENRLLKSQINPIMQIDNDGNISMFDPGNYKLENVIIETNPPDGPILMRQAPNLATPQPRQPDSDTQNPADPPTKPKA